MTADQPASERVAAFHEAGHVVVALANGLLLAGVAIGDAAAAGYGGTRLLQDPSPFAQPDGSVNMEMVRFSVAGAIAEELLTGVSYGADHMGRTDLSRALDWATRGDEIDGAEAWPTLVRAWADTDACLKRRWSHVVLIAEALLSRRLLTTSAILTLLMNVEPEPFDKRRVP